MNRKEFIQKVTQKKVQDYSLTIIFFVVFSFFAIFAIRPNIITAFNLRRELADLRSADRKFEESILNIVNYQTILEEYRDDFYLLDEAVPDNPQIYKITDDVRASATASGMIVDRLVVNELELKNEIVSKQEGMKSYGVNLEVQATNDQVRSFIDYLVEQRRLKTIHELRFSQDSEVGSVSNFTVSFVVESFYL